MGFYGYISSRNVMKTIMCRQRLFQVAICPKNNHTNFITMNRQHNYCIILAGGIGRRLWPVSKQAKPKQFVDIFGVGRTLLQQTFDRFARIMDKDHIIVSTYKEYVPLVKAQLPDLPDHCILAEPVQLSTAPAVAWASCHINNMDHEANIVVSPSDQFIVNEDRFADQIAGGLEFVAQHEEFLAMGAVPTVPNTAYGYIQQGRERIDDSTARVKSFSEKPTLEYAKMFVESGEFLWNTGIFLWQVSTMLSLLKTKGIIMGNWTEEEWRGLTPEQELKKIEENYPSSLHTSVDLVILEKCENVYVRRCDFGWTDVGSWPEIYDVAEKDADGNAVLTDGHVLLTGCRNTLIDLPGNVGAMVSGLDNYLVALNGNQLVICPNDDPGRVRKMVNEAQIQYGDDFA
mgnify:CR=1 FL=1